MALGTIFGQANKITLSVGGVDHTANIIGVKEVTESSGGTSFTTADGVTHKTPAVADVVALEVTLAQDLTAANLWRYMRETTPTTAEVRLTGTASATEGASNPEWVYSGTGWEKPILEWAPGGIATPVGRFYVGNPTVDTTP